LESLAQADRGELIPLELPIKAFKPAPKASKKRK
jgi:hypothetical protein